MVVFKIPLILRKGQDSPFQQTLIVLFSTDLVDRMVLFTLKLLLQRKFTISPNK